MSEQIPEHLNYSKNAWRPISGYDRYLVSDDGRVYSTIRAGRLVKPFVNNAGYEYVALMALGASKPKKFLVHRLVATEFFGASDGRVVNHIDGNKRNNNVSNLEWCSYAENNDHARDTGLVKNFGENHYKTKLTDEDIRRIRLMLKDGIMHKVIGETFGVSRKVITSINTGNSFARVK